MKPSIIKKTVYEIMVDIPETRDNDMLLMVETLKALKLPTDLKELNEVTTSNILESITRCRRKAQEDNPFLAPSENVKGTRRKKEQEYKEWSKNAI